MSVAAGSLDEAGRAGLGTLPKRSLGGLIAISIFWFALNFHWAAVGVHSGSEPGYRVALPTGARRLAGKPG